MEKLLQYKSEMPAWHVLHASTCSVPRIKAALQDSGFTFFYPTNFVLVGKEHEKKKNVERPVVLNLVFLYGVASELERFCELHPYLSLTRAHKTLFDVDRKGLYLVVPDREMEMFQRTVGAYERDVPFINPKEVDLEEGDRVRILDGLFAGVEGTLITQRGKDGGRVLVRISDLVAVPTLEIEPEYIEVLSFAPSNLHAYKKFDAFEKRLDTAVEEVRKHHRITDEQQSAMVVFIRRFTNLQTITRNMKVKHNVFLMMAHKLLLHTQEYEHYRHLVEEMYGDLKSKASIALVKKYLDA